MGKVIKCYLVLNLITEKLKNFGNFDWEAIVTLIDVEQLKAYLDESDYHKEKAKHLILGFSSGFDIGYHGPLSRKDTSCNIPLRLGTSTQLWNKVMDEVEASRYAGPFKFEDLPFSNFMQSLIGLVPKSGNKVHLIFHLLYDFGKEWYQKSLNFHTPENLCSIKYRDMDHAVLNCLRLLQLAKERNKNSCIT